MNRLLDTVYAKHQAWLERGDDRQGVHEPSPEGLAARRLERARVLLVAGGAVGYRAAASLASLPLGLLTLFPMSEADVEPLAQVVKQTRRRAKELNKAPLTFRTPNFVLTAAKYHLVAFAGERPYPDLFESVNESCVRVEAAWTRVTLWGAEITLGPTVLPGATACYNCYMLRRLSNNSRPEVWQAQEQF
ncbi:MAG: hypothetical protein QOC61_1538, partial [Acidobacteriota bacterium]|nr:hypothetical protein [Acidobacteriota bacterium]